MMFIYACCVNEVAGWLCFLFRGKMNRINQRSGYGRQFACLFVKTPNGVAVRSVGRALVQRSIVENHEAGG